MDNDSTPSPNQGDLERLAELEKELTELRDVADAADQLKSTFKAKISHELRTPMHAIIGWADLLLDTELTDEQREYTDELGNATQVLLGVISNLLDFSRTESGQLVMNHLPFDLKMLVQELMMPFTILAREKGLELNVRYAPGLASHLIGDPGWLRQVLSQLVHNAVRFTDKGQVFVDIDSVEDLGSRTRILYSIHDTGIGIPNDKLRSVFEDFTQGDDSSTRKHGGTGLGLSLCKELVEQMNGIIGVESQVGKGSTFWFTLTHQKDAHPPVRERAELGMDNARVLTMEPNRVSQRILTEQLASFNITPEHFDSEDRALAALRHARDIGKPFDIAVVSYNSWNSLGKTLTREIQDDPLLNDTQVIVISSSARRGEADELSLHGVKAYLVKPVYESTLGQTLASLRYNRDVTENRPMITRHNISEFRKVKLPAVHTAERPRSILIVDDDEFFLKSTYRTIKNAFRGAEIQTAGNGVEALILLGGMVPDCVVLDVMMPGMHGDEVAQVLQSKERYSEVRIIAVTGLGEEDQRVKNLRRKGIQKILFKPFESDLLIKEVEAATRPRFIKAT